MLVRAPRHGKMTSASTVGRSRCNQPSLRSYIDCFTTAGWTLDACHFRACKESVALTVIMPHFRWSKKNPGCRTLSKLDVIVRIGQAFQKGFTLFHRITHHQCHIVSASLVFCPLLRHTFTVHFKGLSARWKQSSGQKYKSNQHNWMHIVCRSCQQPEEPVVFSATTALTITLQTSEAWVEAPATGMKCSNL